MIEIAQLSIAPAKISDYLLNLDHVQGGSKAKFFLARGFTREQATAFADALIGQAISGWPGNVMATDLATKYRIAGPIRCPDGTMPEILTVWQAAPGSDTARFVTARPDRRRTG